MVLDERKHNLWGERLLTRYHTVRRPDMVVSSLLTTPNKPVRKSDSTGLLRFPNKVVG